MRGYGDCDAEATLTCYWKTATLNNIFIHRFSIIATNIYEGFNTPVKFYAVEKPILFDLELQEKRCPVISILMKNQFLPAVHPTAKPKWNFGNIL